MREAGRAHPHADASHGWSAGAGDLLHDDPGRVADGDWYLRLVVDESLPVLAHFRVAVDGDGAGKDPVGVGMELDAREVDAAGTGRLPRPNLGTDERYALRPAWVAGSP